MRALGVIAVSAAVVLIVWAIAVVVKVSATRSKHREARRLNEERRKAPWQHFSRPGRYVDSHPTKWVVGVERVLPDGGGAFDPEEMWVGSLDDEYVRIEAEGQAIAKAAKYNDLKVGMQ